MTQRTDTDIIAAIADAYRAWSAEMEREAADVAAGNDTVKPDRKRARLIRGFAFIARRAARAEEWHDPVPYATAEGIVAGEQAERDRAASAEVHIDQATPEAES